MRLRHLPLLLLAACARDGLYYDPEPGDLRGHDTKMTWDFVPAWDQARPDLRRPDATVPDLASSDGAVGAPRIYLADSNGLIRSVGLDGGSEVVLRSGLGAIEDLAIDRSARRLYLIQWPEGGLIRSVGLDGSDLRVIYNSSGGSGGQGVAVDPASDTLFWGKYYGDLFRGSRSGAVPAMSIVPAKQLNGAHGIAVGIALDPQGRHVYFTTRHNNTAPGRALWRVAYDGSELVRLRELVDANCVALDLVHRRLYYGDREGDDNSPAHIYVAALDATGPRAIFDHDGQDYCRKLVVSPSLGKVYILQVSNSRVLRLYETDLSGGGRRELKSLSSENGSVAVDAD